MLPSGDVVGSLLVWVVVGVGVGPPKLPPLPGQGAPAEEPAPTQPQEPAPRPSPQPAVRPAPQPAPRTEPAPRPAPSPSVAAPIDPEAPPPGDFGSEVIEPPQPVPVADVADVDDAEDPASDEGDDENRRPLRRPQGPPDRLPGEESDPASLFRMPPPERPPYGGVGMFIGSGASFAIALGGQIIGHSLLKRSCIDPAGRGEFDDEDAGAVIGRCAQGVVPAVVLRVQAGIALFTTVGLAAGGAALRGRRDAFDDTFSGTNKGRRVPALRAAGIALLGVGAASWLTGAAVAWSLLPRCGTARCANTNRVVALTTRSLSAAIVSAGGGMLVYSEAYRRNASLYRRERAMSIGPDLGRHHLGLSLGGKF